MKIHFDTGIGVTIGYLSLCQRHLPSDHLTRDPADVTCRQCQVRMNDRNAYWLECRPKEGKE